MSDETNPYLRRSEKRSKGSHGLKSEKRIGKTFKNAKSIPGSGAIEGLKGDTRLPDFLIESKATINESYGVKLEILERITREALAINLTPALTVSFTDSQGKARPHGDWIMIPLYTFQELLEK